MYFKIGSFQHETGDVNFLSHQKRYRHSPRGGRLTRVETMHIQVHLKGVDKDELLASILEVQGKYHADGNPCGLYYDDNTASPHILGNSGSIDGVKVMEFSYLNDNGAEQNIWRTLDIILAAEYIDVTDQISEFQETVRYRGTGGPAVEVVQTFDGPIIEVTAVATPVWVFQFGEAKGFQAYPEAAIPPPKFPAYELTQHREIERIGSERGTLNKVNYGMRWRYVMALPSFQLAYPTLR